MTFNPYAAGKKIYNGGSSAATRGPVDKIGYIERDRKAKLNSKSQFQLRMRNAAQRRLK